MIVQQRTGARGLVKHVHATWCADASGVIALERIVLGSPVAVGMTSRMPRW